jgi:error-prone DNA polymerase
MSARGYTSEFARQIFNQIRGFGEYGFPESHSASFALLVYVSAWLKCHEPAAFTCALLNSQPMGFYAPSQLIQCAHRHGVEIRPIDVNHSDLDCTLERADDADSGSAPALRLGLRLVKGLSEAGGRRLTEARQKQSFIDVSDLCSRAGLGKKDCAALAAADALKQIAGHRYRARWDVAGIESPLPLLPTVKMAEGLPLLKSPTEGQEVAADYNSTGLTLRKHPMELLRGRLSSGGILNAVEIWEYPHGEFIQTAGLVVTRQRPGSAKGVFFVTLEDETGHINLIVWDTVAMRQRRVLLDSVLLKVSGKIQREGDVLHIVVTWLEDYSSLLGELTMKSRNFR